MSVTARDFSFSDSSIILTQYEKNLIHWQLVTKIACGVFQFLARQRVSHESPSAIRELKRIVKETKRQRVPLFNNQKGRSKSELSLLIKEIELTCETMHIQGDIEKITKRYKPEEFIIVYTHFRDKRTDTMQVLNMLHDHNVCGDLGDTVVGFKTEKMMESTAIEQEKSKKINAKAVDAGMDLSELPLQMTGLLP